MTKLYRFTGLLTLLLILLCTSVRAQTTIAVMDFEGTAPEMAVSNDVAFFSNGAQGFWGIHDGNNDNTDGNPADTDAANANRIALITSAAIQGDFLFVNDLDDSDNGNMNGTPDRGSVTFGPVGIPAAASDLLFSFDYDVANFNGGDEVFYTLVLNGTPQAEVHFIGASNMPQTGSGTINVVIPDGTSTASLILGVELNGDQSAGFDNFTITSGNPGLPCGVSAFGPTATEECVASTNGVADEYTLTLGYTGSDAGGTLALLVNGSPASAFTNNGDDPTTTSGGTLQLSSPDLVEGTSYEVTFTDVGGSCVYSVSGSVANNTCVSVCDLTADPIRFFCNSFSAGTDGVSAEIRYYGSGAGVTVSATGGITVGGNDPATEPGGTGAANTRKILLSGLQEGGSYTITIGGGACTGADVIVVDATVAANLCSPVGDLIINEFYASPNTGAGEYEFVELYNRGLNTMDISEYSVEEGAGTTIMIPAGTTLGPGEKTVIVGNMSAAPTGCQLVNAPFIGLNNSGDVIILRDGNGLVMQQLNYGAEANTRESIGLSPDGNLGGGYQMHTSISTTGETNSPCAGNEALLPVEMLSFSGAPNGKTVVLNWETATEIDADRYLVERLVADNDWANIGEVVALNEVSNTYGFTDESPLQGNNVYRLQQVDFDGTTAPYGPVVVAFSTKELSVWPNPASNEVRFSGSLGNDAQVSLLNANGQVLRALPTGSNRANLSGMPAGIYLLRVARASGTEVVRFVKD